MSIYLKIAKPLAMAGLVALAACTGNRGDKCHEAKPQPTNENKEAAVKSLLKRMPTFVVKDEKTGKYLRVADGGFNFSNSGDGWDFSHPSGYNYTAGPNGTGGTVTISSSAFGSNGAAGTSGSSGGGAIGAGSTNLSINYTYCFSADAQATGLDLFSSGSGPALTGVSGVLGVAGDFSALASGTPDSSQLANSFKGLAMYVVYAKQASGGYDILDWLSPDNTNATPSDLNNKGFAFIIDFQNQRIFFSERGRLNVSGGSISYSGSYLMAEYTPSNQDQMQVTSVAGFGAMGCN